jgi:putative toxin-antitoxin system antitoxin component (TIGR02293 family)
MKVRKAVAVNTVRAAREWMGLSDSEIARATGAHRRTVQRWINGGAAPRPLHADKMEQLRELLHLLQVVFNEPDAAQEWLYSPVPMLRGRSPISLVQDNRSEEVIAILAGLASGAHA